MMQLTTTASQTVDNIAQRFGLSRDAVLHMLDAVQRGGGTMAQFNHPELGGGGQWMQGGMTMVGDMFNHQLKATVDNLCLELSGLLNTQPFVPPPPSVGGWQSSGAWWPMDLGSPASSGAQNNIRYAYFPGPRRLAIEVGGMVKLYDTGDHQIQGVSQQQGGSNSLSFSSQFGTVSVSDLQEVGAAANEPVPPMSPTATPMPMEPATPPPPEPSAPAPQVSTPPVGQGGGDSAAILATLEKLAELHDRGVLSEAEFSAKKAELLGRL